MERIDDDHKLSSLRQYKTLNISVVDIAALNCCTTITVVVIMFVVKERSVERIFYRNDVASLDVGQLLAILTIVGNKPVENYFH